MPRPAEGAVGHGVFQPAASVAATEDAPEKFAGQRHADRHGHRLYVHFGHMGTAALDLSGKVIWRQTELNTRRSMATAARRCWWTTC